MTSTAPDITKDLRDLQTQIRDLERSLEDLFSMTFAMKIMARDQGVSLIVKNGQQLQELYRLEKALVKINR